MSEKLEKLRAMLEKEKDRRIKLNNRIEILERRIQEAEAAEVNEMVHSAGNVPIGWSASTVPGFFPACMVGLWRWAE